MPRVVNLALRLLLVAALLASRQPACAGAPDASGMADTSGQMTHDAHHHDAPSPTDDAAHPDDHHPGGPADCPPSHGCPSGLTLAAAPPVPSLLPIFDAPGDEHPRTPASITLALEHRPPKA